ncbi:MAG TPA: hypothetical protein VGF91_17590 [Solirubrobacteraceae bacterium]
MATRPLEIAVSAHTSASPEHVLAAARDFSERRPELWPNVKAKYFVVHDKGEEFADVTEGIWITGLFWERSRYDWSEPGAVRATVIDSNVVQPGSTFEVRAVRSEGGSDVEMTLCRTFQKGPKGRIGGAINHLSGNRGWRSYLRRVLANVETATPETSARPYEIVEEYTT